MNMETRRGTQEVKIVEMQRGKVSEYETMRHDSSGDPAVRMLMGEDVIRQILLRTPLIVSVVFENGRGEKGKRFRIWRCKTIRE
ncbi:hypothetical protein E2C01_052994 [Portunus trituberculatus]|uniref:Uncharacterized protein n=1 Tax=Portunus trituberculatus TaxID=210409 RepID=A0A5B7GMZ7_PORTR|nr:hypothetical protein [Portunus trituberculatus]